jgi:hypothetical protein
MDGVKVQELAESALRSQRGSSAREIPFDVVQGRLALRLNNGSVRDDAETPHEARLEQGTRLF